jgi:ribosomal protein L11 methyltransferase
MLNHIQITFSDLQPEQQEILIAHLTEIGFESFEEKEKQLDAFVAENNYDELLLNNLAYKYQLTFQKEIIPERNWNEIWESHFNPVIIEDFVAIRADFHSSIPHIQHEIIITPKMSFGTGHHATTRMMIQQMKSIDFNGKVVFDFGTGTGILSILAEKLGAERIIAIDNDVWSIENAKENFQRNNTRNIELTQTPLSTLTGKFDVILANINKHIILENFYSLAEKLKKNGSLVVSGLMIEDEREILQAAENYHLLMQNTQVENNWLCIRFDN